MSNRIVLISDDINFFDFIKLKLELRNSDSLFTLCFDEVPEKLDFLKESLLIVNSEGSKQKTIDLLKIFNYTTPIIVTAYNDDDIFKRKCYRSGMLDYIPLLTSDSEFRARMLPALSLLSLLEKNKQYRQILVKNNIISKNNDVYVNYEHIIDNTLSDLKNNHLKAVFAAIAPDERNKYLINPSVIEILLLNNIRKNDILMKYMHNKYFLIMLNTDLVSAKKHWNKIIKNFHNKIYAGFVDMNGLTRQQLINNALSNLNEAYAGNTGIICNINAEENQSSESYTNFKMLRKSLAQKLELLVTPVFYRVQQKYLNRLTGVKIEQYFSNGQGIFNIVGKHFYAKFNITSPGFTKINIDITVKKEPENPELKRITFNPNELDSNLLEDLLEQFIAETKSYGM